MRRLAPTLLLLAVLPACEGLLMEKAPASPQPTPAEIFSSTADATFRLESADEKSLPETVDPVAVERFLAWVRPQYRGEALKALVQLGNPSIALADVQLSFPNPEIGTILRQVRRVPPQPRNDSKP